MELSVVVLDTHGCGARSLVQRFCAHDQSRRSHGNDTEYKGCVLIDDEVCTLNISCVEVGDNLSANDERWITHASGFLLLYNVTKRSTLYAAGDGLGMGFLGLGFFREEILRAKDSDDVPMVLGGSNCHKESKRQVTLLEGQTLAEQWRCPFLEISTKSKVNHENCFLELVNIAQSLRLWLTHGR